MAIYDFFLSRNGSASITAENYLGHVGRLFYDSDNGVIKISDGVTPGGLFIPYTIATDTIVGGIKEGPGVTINSEGQILLDSAGLEFTFGDFQGIVGTYAAGNPQVGEDYALLQSVNANEDIVIASNGTGIVKILGDFSVRSPNGSIDGALLLEPIFRVFNDGKVRFLVPNADPLLGAFEVIGNDTGAIHPPNQTGVIMHTTGNEGLPARKYLDGVNNYPVIVGRRYNGSVGALTPVLNNEIFFRVVGQASTGTDFETFGPAKLNFIATEDQGPNNQGGKITFDVTANGTDALNFAVTALEVTATGIVSTVGFVGDLTGNVTIGSGNTLDVTGATVTGLTFSGFDPADVAGTMTGTTLNSTVVNSSLTSVGTLTDLTVTNPIVGDGSQLTGVRPTVLSALASVDLFLAVSQDATTITNMTLSPPAGSYLVTFNSEYVNTLVGSVTSTAAADLAILYNDLQALPATVTGHAPAYGGGETLGPGVYTQAGASSIAGTLTLDAGGDPAALFVFRSAGALTTGAGATIVLAGGATSKNVWWVAEGAISTGNNATIRGSLLSNQAANTPGSGATVEGRVLAVNGAIGVNNIDILEPTGISTLDEASLSIFSIFAGIGSLTNANASTIAQSIGTNNGTITGFGTATVSGEIYPGGAADLGVIEYGIYVDGVEIPDSNRRQTHTFLTSAWPMSIHTIATVGAGQILDVRTTVPIGEFAIGPGMALIASPIST